MSPTRRRFALLAGLLPLSVAGCLAAGTTEDPDRTTPTAEASRLGVQFEPATDGGSIRSRERVILTNDSSDSVYLSGYTLAYSSGQEYTFSGLTLEPRADVAVVSKGTSDLVARSDPPTYYRGAGFDSQLLADGEETVTLLTPDDEVVLEAAYEA